MRDQIKNHAVLFLAAFVLSLLLFSAAMPRFVLYLAVLCAVEWGGILLYGRGENLGLFIRALLTGLGNALAFAFQWRLMGRDVCWGSLDGLELALLAVLAAGGLFVGGAMVSQAAGRRKAARPAAGEEPQLFPERKCDLQRLEGFLENGTQLIGIDASWGDGKTFLIDRLCGRKQISDRYEIVRIHALAGNEDEIELTLMQEFDRILRRNRIFSLASKQMLKLLESSDVLKQLQWLLVEDTQSVSATFSNVLRDLEKLDKDVLIIVDDIERLGDDVLIRKLFALMESVSSGKVRVLYLFNSRMLNGFDRDYLEKYIPCYMTLTPVRFATIVEALWKELNMDAAGVERKKAAELVRFPGSSSSILQILALEPGELRSFRLEHITVRRVRIFLEEFRDLMAAKAAPEGEETPGFSSAERELFLKCLFIKHFLPDHFEKLALGTSLVDSPLFCLGEEAKAYLKGNGHPVPDDVSLLYLLGVRRQLRSAAAMRDFTETLLADERNYNCLTALSMLEFDFSDIWQELQQPERSGGRPGQPAPSGRGARDLQMARAEQIGNEDISAIVRERNNERIDRVMWNLLANGTSELANIDAYVRHFQETVLAAAPEDQQAARRKFSEDAYHGRIYKDNVTRERFGTDPYLPLFQGFRVTNASAERWLELLACYFRAERDISVEMVQNLVYADLMDRRVYLAVLKGFARCEIRGNLNEEPCMYRFLTHALRMACILGYTKSAWFHDLRYGVWEPQTADSLTPSPEWEKAVLELAAQFGEMKDVLEQEKLPDPRLEWFNADLAAIQAFLDQCGALIGAKTVIRMRIPRIEVQQSTHSRHQEKCDSLREELRSGADRDVWLKKVEDAYEAGELDPMEIRELVGRMAEGEPRQNE